MNETRPFELGPPRKSITERVPRQSYDEGEDVYPAHARPRTAIPLRRAQGEIPRTSYQEDSDEEQEVRSVRSTDATEVRRTRNTNPPFTKLPARTQTPKKAPQTKIKVFQPSEEQQNDQWLQQQLDLEEENRRLQKSDIRPKLTRRVRRPEPEVYITPKVKDKMDRFREAAGNQKAENQRNEEERLELEHRRRL
jgi:hypothetical protein